MSLAANRTQQRTFDQLRSSFQPIFERIAEGTVQRERDHVLPYEQVKWLVEAGFPALRVPVDQGGAGISIAELAVLLSDLAAADSNIPQIFRGHIAFVEHQRHNDNEEQRNTWFSRFVSGEFVGNAWTEVGASTVGKASTRLHRTGNGLILEGEKYYTTGSIFADWIDVTATDDDEKAVSVLVRRSDAGVEVSDDWDGFGQQLTGTGSARFRQVAVAAENVELFDNRFSYQTALYQLVLLSVLTGVSKAVLRDTVSQVQGRARVYSHGNADRARDDSQIQSVVGEISSAAFTAEAILRSVAEAIDAVDAIESVQTSDETVLAEHTSIRLTAELASARGQITLSESVPRAATLLFNTLGASATSRQRDLDRHWRNARTVASHNPVIYKQRAVGAWELNGTEPQLLWGVGLPESSSSSRDDA